MASGSKGRNSGSSLAINQGIQETSRENMKAIQAKVAHNLELQGIILKTISDYESAQEKAKAQGSSVVEVVKRKRMNSSAPADGAAPEIEDTVLRRGQTVYKNWANKLCSQLLNYLDPEALDLQTLKRIDDLTQYQHLMQYGCDLLLGGDTPDKVGSPNKKLLFQGLKQVYQQLGSRFNSLNFEVLPLDWQKCGHYMIQVNSGKVMLQCKPLGETVEIGQNVLHGDPGPYTVVENNSSLKLATLVTRKDSYKLQNFFPRLSRSLKRRLSDDLGVTMPPDQVSATTSSAAAAASDAPTPNVDNIEDEDVPPEPIT